MMRVIRGDTGTGSRFTTQRASARASNVELLGMLAGSLVILLGLILAIQGRLHDRRGGSTEPIVLQTLKDPAPLAPLLTMFTDPYERRAVAAAILTRATGSDAIDHVGALADVTIPARSVSADRRFAVLRERLSRRPNATAVPVLTPGDIADLKPALAVRTRADYIKAIRVVVLWFFGAFWFAHIVRRVRRAQDDPVVLPVLLLLSGIGLMAMIALRDPLRDSLSALPFTGGVTAGLLALLLVSEVDLEASPLRRATFVPLSLALVLAAALLVLGSGPGSSGVKVNLFGFQPVEAIRLLVVFALAAYFSRRLDLLREYSEPAPPERPWLNYIKVPRWRDVRGIIASMALVLAFFFLQKDLGPALVLSCVVIAMYAVARGKGTFVAVGFAMMIAAFAVAYFIGHPATVRQRVQIWMDPWNNGVAGGNQVAHGLWALSTGAIKGSGPGLGSPQSIPAGHTDFVLAAIGEELGFIGLAAIVSLYALLCWRCLRVALRAPGDYSAFLVTGVALALVVQAFVIGSGLLGLFPLSGVVTPFLSYGRSSMLANCAAVGVVLAVARRRGEVRRQFERPMQILGTVLAAFTLAVVSRAAWIQIVKADDFATMSALSEQADGGYRFEYNPRLVAASRLLERGSIYDRNGLPIATSRTAEMGTIDAEYRKAGVVPLQACHGDDRCYPMGGQLFNVIGDWNNQINWGARNSSYLERDSDATLKGFDDRQRLVDVRNQRTGTMERAVKRDYRDLLPVVREGLDSNGPALKALLAKPRDVRSTIDVRLQSRVASALRTGIERGTHTRGAAVVMDVDTGDVLASVTYPWPASSNLANATTASVRKGDDGTGALLDRARYGLYPPGSTFKLIVAGAALRTDRQVENETFVCSRLPDGRVGNFVRGQTRPVRDDPMDTTPHGDVNLHRGLVVSCNAYFAQLAMRIGAAPIVDAASLFQIETARPSTAGSLKRTLAHAGYGQGEVLVSPFKMTRVVAAIAGHGVVTPARWLVEDAPADETQPRFLSDGDASELSKYMREVVTSGTGRTLATNATPIAGKTGTAEVDGQRAHSWFAGFAPYGGTRRIAFAVIVENAGYGARAAAPIAGEIVNASRELGLIK